MKGLQTRIYISRIILPSPNSSRQTRRQSKKLGGRKSPFITGGKAHGPRQRVGPGWAPPLPPSIQRPSPFAWGSAPSPQPPGHVDRAPVTWRGSRAPHTRRPPHVRRAGHVSPPRRGPGSAGGNLSLDPGSTVPGRTTTVDLDASRLVPPRGAPQDQRASGARSAGSGSPREDATATGPRGGRRGAPSLAQ